MGMFDTALVPALYSGLDPIGHLLVSGFESKDACENAATELATSVGTMNGIIRTEHKCVTIRQL